MKIHLFYIIYIISIICGAGWYINEQKTELDKKDNQIQELIVEQEPPIVPDKRKVKVVEKEVVKEVPVKDEKCVEQYEKLKQKAIQCAYNLQFCQQSSEIYNQMKSKEKEKD